MLRLSLNPDRSLQHHLPHHLLFTLSDHLLPLLTALGVTSAVWRYNGKKNTDLLVSFAITKKSQASSMILKTLHPDMQPQSDVK